MFDLPYLVNIPLVVAALLSLLFRFRTSLGIERLQLKWFVFAMVVAVGTTLLRAASTEGAVIRFEIVAAVGTLTVPVAAGIAIMRYRLYDIDRIINRTLVYGALTAILAAGYLAIVVTFQRLVPGADASDLTVAASTLAVAAVFRPLRTRVQSFIDHRFYRRRFDAQRTLESFSSRARDDVDLDHLAAELVSVVSDTMQPAHASLWLRTQASSPAAAANTGIAP